ncbi:GIY-YIG nuclease family protein [Pandoraea norimbergensis]|uniref:GIY-YIG nuclease family protein n=1 Tax=Pandoraea norimbergensis TaxID=93219 RepID=UPI000A00FBD5|nr:GIY-YIG nuclease family protein [Pandoraea norimbergensis]
MTGALPGKPWFLYLLECAGGRIYTGITVDVQARYAAHVAGKGARFTRAHPPSGILLSMTFADRSAASRAEYRVKQLSAPQKRALIAGTLAVDFGVSDAVPAVKSSAGEVIGSPKSPSRRRKVTAPDAPVE